MVWCTTMNDFGNIPAESEFRVEMTLTTEDGELTIDQDTPLSEILGNQDTRIEPEETPLGEIYGSGEDTE